MRVCEGFPAMIWLNTINSTKVVCVRHIQQQSRQPREGKI